MLKTFDSINSITQVKQSSGNLKKGKKSTKSSQKESIIGPTLPNLNTISFD